MPEAERAPRPTVALVSGGVDSCIMLARTLKEGRLIHPLYVRQGALWEDEEELALRRFLRALGQLQPEADGEGCLAPLSVMWLDLPARYAARWAVDPAVKAPDETTPDKSVYLPGRNMALLLQGAMLAHSVGAVALQMGLLAGNPFTDSRPEFFGAFTEAFALATGHRLEIETPLHGLKKAELLHHAQGLPLELTFSCLRPAEGRHCGRCNKCAERHRAFSEAGVEDPTEYGESGRGSRGVRELGSGY